MAEVSPEPVKTFSIGFEEERYNELPQARRVAAEFAANDGNVASNFHLLVEPSVARDGGDVTGDLRLIF